MTWFYEDIIKYLCIYTNVYDCFHFMVLYFSWSWGARWKFSSVLTLHFLLTIKPAPIIIYTLTMQPYIENKGSKLVHIIRNKNTPWNSTHPQCFIWILQTFMEKKNLCSPNQCSLLSI